MEGGPDLYSLRVVRQNTCLHVFQHPWEFVQLKVIIL